MQFSPTRDLEGVGVAAELDPQGHIGLELTLKPLTNLAAGDELALPPGQGRVIHNEVHGQGGLVHLQHGQRLHGGGVADRGADVELLNAIDEHDVAGLGHVDLLALEAAKLQHLIDACLARLALWPILNDDILKRPNTAAGDATNPNLPHIAVVVE